MVQKQKLSRNKIIQALIEALEPLDYVHAFYEGGAAAFGRVDQWSDIDLYAVVDDPKVADTFLAVERALEQLSRMKQKLTMPQLPWPDAFQTFYKLEGTSEYLIIDFAVLKLNAPEKFLEPGVHGNVVFYFNKDNGVVVPKLDQDVFATRLKARVERLKARYQMFSVFVQKEINRSNWLEAMDMYHAFVLGSLVEALRMKHSPLHYDFRSRYVHYELPKDVVEKLERLSFVRCKSDLQRKYDAANKWFIETVSQIRLDDLGKSIGASQKK